MIIDHRQSVAPRVHGHSRLAGLHLCRCPRWNSSVSCAATDNLRSKDAMHGVVTLGSCGEESQSWVVGGDRPQIQGGYWCGDQVRAPRHIRPINLTPDEL